MKKMITLEIAYATPSIQKIILITIRAGSTIAEAIEHSSILQDFPEINLTQQAVGIFGEVKSLTTEVHAGDRVEIYRPLLLDPKEQRRLKARKAKQKKSS